jgi:hypothetical protein
LGTHKLSGDDSTVLKLATETYFLHPEYNPDTLENDIGLIKLRMPVTITGKRIFVILHSSSHLYVGNINQLYLPYVDVTDVSVGTAFGWGQTSDSK